MEQKITQKQAVNQKAVIPFSYESNQVRTATMDDGSIWFVAADVCSVLGIQNPTKALRALDNDERSNFWLGRQGSANIINESGLYTLIIRSNKPNARKFRKWVTSVVLPAIRKTGQYVPDQPIRAEQIKAVTRRHNHLLRFITEACDLGRDFMVEKGALYDAYLSFCDATAQPPFCREYFFRNLYAASQDIVVTRPRINHARIKIIVGICPRYVAVDHSLASVRNNPALNQVAETIDLTVRQASRAFGRLDHCFQKLDQCLFAIQTITSTGNA